MLTSVSLVFFLSWVPINIFNMIMEVTELHIDPDWLLMAYALCHLSAMSTTLSNPILSGFLNRNFQEVSIQKWI